MLPSCIRVWSNLDEAVQFEKRKGVLDLVVFSACRTALGMPMQSPGSVD